MKLRKAVPLAILTSCAVLTSSGCTGFLESHRPLSCPPPAAAGLAIAVGARANSPQPVVPSAVGTRIVAAMRACRKITVIRVDGRPSVAGSLTFSTAARTQQNLNIDQAAFLDRVKELIATARARQPEANVLQALSVAAGAAGNGGTVVLIDSGVQTSDPLDFRKNNLTSRRPAAVVDALKQQHLLPDLSGRSLILAALGYTAAPQDALQDKNRAFLLDLWRGIVVAAGARNPQILEEPNTNASAVSSPAVSVVRFPTAAIHPLCDTLSVLPDSGEVGFVTNAANFRNPTAASTVLGKLAGFLLQNPTARVRIEGFVAHYGAGDLSQRRADRVKQELMALGAANPITAQGMGWGPYPNTAAPPDTRYDSLNRQVTIEVTC
jgi:OmpA-OmpF porin, OOP family